MFSGIDHIALFIAAGLLLNFTPGPDVLYILTHAIKSGWRAGAVAALGITAGCFVHIAAAALGVSVLIAASSTAFMALKWLGAAYLAYVGWSMLGLGKMLFGKPIATNTIAIDAIQTGASGQKSLKKVFISGFWTNALNPKVALFFLAFLPQFISPSAQHKTITFVVLGLLFNFNGLWVNFAYAALGAVIAKRLTVLQRGMLWLERTAGALFIGFGLKLALSDQTAH